MGIRSTHPALPMFTYVVSVNLPRWMRASKQALRSPVKDPGKGAVGRRVCCGGGDAESVVVMRGEMWDVVCRQINTLPPPPH